jgi:hypothetical protein
MRQVVRRLPVLVFSRVSDALVRRGKLHAAFAARYSRRRGPRSRKPSATSSPRSRRARRSSQTAAPSTRSTSSTRRGPVYIDGEHGEEALPRAYCANNLKLADDGDMGDMIELRRLSPLCPIPKSIYSFEPFENLIDHGACLGVFDNAVQTQPRHRRG